MTKDVVLHIVKAHGRSDRLIDVRGTQYVSIVIVELYPVKQLIIAFQRLIGIGQGFLVVAHLQVDACGQRIGGRLIGIEHVQCLFGQCRQSLVNILKNEIIDSLDRRLRVGSTHLGTGNQGHTAIVSRCRCVIGLGIIVHEGEILHGPQDLGLCYNLPPLGIGGFGRCGRILDKQVGGRDTGISIVIGCLITLVHGNAVSILIPEVVGIPQLIIGQVAIRDIAIVEQEDRLCHIFTAVSVLIGKHDREVVERGGNLLSLRHIAQIIITTAQACKQHQAGS